MATEHDAAFGIKRQIKVVKQLLEATEELNNEFQEGWGECIENAKQLLTYLNEELKKVEPKTNEQKPKTAKQ